VSKTKLNIYFQQFRLCTRSGSKRDRYSRLIRQPAIFLKKNSKGRVIYGKNK